MCTIPPAVGTLQQMERHLTSYIFSLLLIYTDSFFLDRIKVGYPHKSAKFGQVNMKIYTRKMLLTHSETSSCQNHSNVLYLLFTCSKKNLKSNLYYLQGVSKKMRQPIFLYISVGINDTVQCFTWAVKGCPPVRFAYRQRSER